MNKLLAIIDLDGTLCDISDIAMKAGPEPSRDNKALYTSWADYMTGTLEDLKANEAVLETVRALYRGGAQIVYLTSRELKHRGTTQRWLNKHAAPYGPLLMRGYDDWRSTADLKGSIIKGLLQEYKGPVVAIDDDRDGSVSSTYKALGVSHLKCLVNINEEDAA